MIDLTFEELAMSDFIGIDGIEFVKVVKCKDCKYWIQFCEAYAACDCGHGVTDAEFYCRDGERRSE